MHGITFSFVQAVVVLAISFFVLSFSIKQEVRWLKTFGFTVAVLLWVSAALVFGKGVSGHAWNGREHSFHPGQKMWAHCPFMKHGMPGGTNAPDELMSDPDDNAVLQDNAQDE